MGIVDDTSHEGHCSECEETVRVGIQWKEDCVSWITVEPHTCEGTHGHLIIGKNRIIKKVDNTHYLECGCTITEDKLEGHVWTLKLDFSKCRDHKHD